jgi:hypothetical protein
MPCFFLCQTGNMAQGNFQFSRPPPCILGAVQLTASKRNRLREKGWGDVGSDYFDSFRVRRKKYEDLYDESSETHILKPDVECQVESKCACSVLRFGKHLVTRKFGDPAVCGPRQAARGRQAGGTTTRGFSSGEWRRARQLPGGTAAPRSGSDRNGHSL